MEILPYNNKLKERSQDLRNKSTLAEVLLWKELQGRKILGYEFRRQRPINNYIVDFYCKKLQLAIEIDGSSHDLKIEEDRFRQDQLESLGIVILRFTNDEVQENREGVLEIIKETIIAIKTSPARLRRGTPSEGGFS